MQLEHPRFSRHLAIETGRARAHQNAMGRNVTYTSKKRWVCLRPGGHAK